MQNYLYTYKPERYGAPFPLEAKYAEYAGNALGSPDCTIWWYISARREATFSAAEPGTIVSVKKCQKS